MSSLKEKKVSVPTKIVLTFLFTLVAGIAMALGGLSYYGAFGYRADKIEAELCGGHWLAYQQTDGLTSPLRCLRTPKNEKFPSWMAGLQVPHDSRFTLSEMDELCGPGTKPRVVEGKLKCVTYPKG